MSGAHWLSGRVLDSKPRGGGFEPHRHHCVVSLSRTHLSLLSAGSTREDPSRHNWKSVYWEVKIKIKQTILQMFKTPCKLVSTHWTCCWGAQWLSGRVLDLRPRGSGFEPHRRHYIVSLSKNINPSVVLAQPRNTPPFIIERLLIRRKETN